MSLLQNKIEIHQGENFVLGLGISDKVNGSYVLNDLSGQVITLKISSDGLTILESHDVTILPAHETDADGDAFNASLEIVTSLEVGSYTSQLHIVDAAGKLHVHDYHTIEVLKTYVAP